MKMGSFEDAEILSKWKMEGEYKIGMKMGSLNKHFIGMENWKENEIGMKMDSSKSRHFIEMEKRKENINNGMKMDSFESQDILSRWKTGRRI